MQNLNLQIEMMINLNEYRLLGCVMYSDSYRRKKGIGEMTKNRLGILPVTGNFLQTVQRQISEFQTVKFKCYVFADIIF